MVANKGECASGFHFLRWGRYPETAGLFIVQKNEPHIHQQAAAGGKSLNEQSSNQAVKLAFCC